MATTFRLEHDFPDIPVDLFEKHLNHPELIAMLAGMPAFRSRDLVEKKELGGGAINWRFKVVAGGDIPASARAVMNEDMLTWHEDTRFVPAEHVIHWTIEPLKDKVKGILSAHGTWKLTPHKFGDKEGTRRVIEGNITVKVPLVGKVVEQFIANELKKNYDVEPEIQRKFYKQMKDREG